MLLSTGHRIKILHTARQRESAGGCRALRSTVEELGPRLAPAVTFAAPQAFAVGAYPFDIVSVDFNGDGGPTS
jgi:hypothetical protein